MHRLQGGQRNSDEDICDNGRGLWMIKIRLEGPAKTQEFFFPRLDIGLEVLGRRPGWGKNQATLHSRVPGYPEYSWIHSEAAALKRAHMNTKSQESFSVINIRINRFGELRCSKPCQCCEFYLRLFGCKEVYYTTLSGFERMKL